MDGGGFLGGLLLAHLPQRPERLLPFLAGLGNGGVLLVDILLRFLHLVMNGPDLLLVDLLGFLGLFDLLAKRDCLLIGFISLVGNLLHGLLGLSLCLDNGAVFVGLEQDVVGLLGLLPSAVLLEILAIALLAFALLGGAASPAVPEPALVKPLGPLDAIAGLVQGLVVPQQVPVGPLDLG